MFKGSFTALITPFKGDALDEDALASSSNGKSQKARTASSSVGTTGGEVSFELLDEEHKRVVEITIETARKRAPVMRRRLQLDGRSDRAFTACAGSRCGRRARCNAILQQADAGRALPALQGDQRRHRHPDLHLQYPWPLRGRHESPTMARLFELKNIAGVNKRAPIDCDGRQTLRRALLRERAQERVGRGVVALRGSAEAQPRTNTSRKNRAAAHASRGADSRAEEAASAHRPPELLIAHLDDDAVSEHAGRVDHAAQR